MRITLIAALKINEMQAIFLNAFYVKVIRMLFGLLSPTRLTWRGQKSSSIFCKSSFTLLDVNKVIVESQPQFKMGNWYVIKMQLYPIRKPISSHQLEILAFQASTVMLRQTDDDGQSYLQQS